MEVKGSDPKYTYEVVGIYRAQNKNVRVIERLAARTGFLGNAKKLSITGGDLNLLQIDQKEIAEGTSQAKPSQAKPSQAKPSQVKPKC